MIARILLLSGILLVDVITTWAGLALGGTEANPAMSVLVSNPLIHLAFKLGILLTVAAVLELSFRFPEAVRFRDRGYCMIGSVYLIVLFSNLLQITAMALC
jgi:hypothetical protein